MSAIKDGGPAFPCAEMAQNSSTGETVTFQWSHTGVTLRDYFAAKAMQGFCANPDGILTTSTYEKIAEMSYVQADVMLAAREAKP